MARGKAAAQAANRRLSDAQERIAALEQQLSECQTARRAERDELRVELERARGVTNRQVAQLAAEQIKIARDEANSAILEARAHHLAQVVAGLAYLEAIPGVQLGTEDVGQWADIAEAFGVDAGPLLDGLMRAKGERPSRHLKRTSNATARWKADVDKKLQSGEYYIPDRKLVHDADRWREP